MSGNLSWDNPPGDNLGNHAASQNLSLNGNNIALDGGFLSGDDDSEGISIDNSGNVFIYIVQRSIKNIFKSIVY